MRKKKAFLALIGIIACTFIVHSYMQKGKEKLEFSDNLYGIPIYTNSRFFRPMSSLLADPYTAVFLTDDSYDKVVEFYKEKMKMDCTELTYGRGNLVAMKIYQFKLKDGYLTNQINKGVEVVPFNRWSRKVYKATTKIKIILPREEVDAIEAEKKKRKIIVGESRE